MCYLCVIEASRDGAYIRYLHETPSKCKIHNDFYLWKVRSSDERNDLIRRVILIYEQSKLRNEDFEDNICRKTFY